MVPEKKQRLSGFGFGFFLYHIDLVRLIFSFFIHCSLNSSKWINIANFEWRLTFYLFFLSAKVMPILGGIQKAPAQIGYCLNLADVLELHIDFPSLDYKAVICILD